MKNPSQPLGNRRDVGIGAVVGLAVFVLYLRTLAPSVAFLFDDTLEFQYVVPRLGIPHPTGYPLYSLLGKLFSLLVPLNDPAFQLNLFSAVSAAVAVSMVYFALRRLTSFRFAAIIGALVFALGRTFWAQAVIAEIYALQMLLVAIIFYLAITWADSRRMTSSSLPLTDGRRGEESGSSRKLYLLAFGMGLGMAHHRLILLLFPAIAIYVLMVYPRLLRDWRVLLRALVVFCVPLSLYLYLPIRGAIGSANGLYENTWEGFWTWVTGRDYAVFLTQDPFRVQHDAAFYVSLFQTEFGATALALAAVGLVWLLRRPREWLLLTVSLVIPAAFVLNYRVADVEVHFLTTFMLLAVLLGAGADAMFSILNSSGRAAPLKWVAYPLLAILLLFLPLKELFANYAVNDLSDKWDIHDYGLDVLSQPLERNATIVGIQGEATLIRYLQEARGRHPDIQTIAADDPQARLASVQRAIAEKRNVYLTRPLEGVERQFSLSSAGPLIRISGSAPRVIAISHPLDGDLGSVRLLGYDVDTSRLSAQPDKWHLENGRQIRVTLFWQPTEKLDENAMVSIKLVGADAGVVGQLDRHPVLDAYPTTAWRVGEIVTDTYDVPVFVGAPPGEYVLKVTMYSETKQYGEQQFERVRIGPDLEAPSAFAKENWNIAHIVRAEYGDLGLAGFSLGEGPVRPGDALPIELLWQAHTTPIAEGLVTRVWLEDAAGKAMTTRDAPLGKPYPPSLWGKEAYVRDFPAIRVPANAADGKYSVKLAVARGSQLLGESGLFRGTSAVRLGEIQVQNRPRVMAAQPIAIPLEATFGQEIRLLGYELVRDIPARGVRLTLYWKAVGVIDTSYAVFVHVLDEANQVRASGDSVPGNGEFPTTGWIENEYIKDIHAFTLPADLGEGGFPIEIGLYEPASGTRLKTIDGKDRLILTTINLSGDASN